MQTSLVLDTNDNILNENRHPIYYFLRYIAAAIDYGIDCQMFSQWIITIINNN